MNDILSPTRSRVLVVDEIPKNLQVVGTLLRNEGYEAGAVDYFTKLFNARPRAWRKRCRIFSVRTASSGAK